MNKPKKILVSTVAVASLAFLASGVYAQSPNSELPFVKELAQKLDMDETELNTLVGEVREEHRETMREQKTQAIAQAVAEGKLTERQSQLLSAKEQYRIETGTKGMGQQNSGEMLEVLNEQGLNVTHEEMQELREAMSDLGFGGQMRRGGQR